MERLIDGWVRRGINKQVIEAFKAIPRHLFVPAELKNEAYRDYPLPIGFDATISQPSTVIIMLDALELKEGDKVLEIGTGSGWNACLISYIVKDGSVYTTEVVHELVKLAKDNIKKVNIKNIKVIETDGSKGYIKEAPYDAIILTAATPKIPDILLKQLKDGGRLLAPVGDLDVQKMVKAVKQNGELIKKSLGDFMFVQLIGKYGFSKKQ